MHWFVLAIAILLDPLAVTLLLAASVSGDFPPRAIAPSKPARGEVR
jgi:hypothetical protein